MIDLFTKYHTSEIIVFVVLMALAIKEAVGLIDWIKLRMDKGYDRRDEQNKAQEEIDDIKDYLEKRKKFLNEMNDKINFLSSQIKILINSDKAAIKAYITREHHFFCYQKKWIDDYSMDCIEKRYSHYKEEGGNSFIDDLIEELRDLPKEPKK